METNAETLKMLQDLKNISYNHLAPLLDGIGNMKCENESLMRAVEGSRLENQELRRKIVIQEHMPTRTGAYTRPRLGTATIEPVFKRN